MSKQERFNAKAIDMFEIVFPGAKAGEERTESGYSRGTQRDFDKIHTIAT